MADGKKKRTPKRSAGERKSSRPVRLTPLEKALMGGGIVRAFKPATRELSRVEKHQAHS